MKNRNIYLYIAGACFFAMCGSLWNEFVAPHLKLETKATGLKPESCPLRSNGAERSERNLESLNPGSHLNRESLNPETRYYAVPKAAVESFPFDPNEADSTQLLRLGLTPAQVRSIYRHRAKGYVYSTPEDFARTPFMTKGQWNHLKPLIKIGEQYRLLNSSLTDNIRPRRAPQQARLIEAEPSRMSMERSYMNRSPLSAPTADSLATVSRSVRSENQDSTLHSSLLVLHLNDASFKALVHHPFLSYEQVKAVKNFQRKYGRIRNMTELLILPEFTVEDTLRLSPYLQF